MGKPEGVVEQGTLPDFLIIGAQKGGTTFLYNALRRHPYFKAATKKEIHFFDTQKYAKKGLDWYREQFPSPKIKNGAKVLTGEASPYYMFHPLVPRRVAECLPDVRLIALLRNPIDRAYSDYQHKVRQGNEELSFEDAIDAEEERIAGEQEKIHAREDYMSRAYRRYTYLLRGIYVDQIQEWHRYFDSEQLLIIKSEDFREEPESALKQVQAFLGLPERGLDIEVVQGRNVGGYQQQMDPQTRRRLQVYFEPHNRRLYDYLGRDFGWNG